MFKFYADIQKYWAENEEGNRVIIKEEGTAGLMMMMMLMDMIVADIYFLLMSVVQRFRITVMGSGYCVSRCDEVRVSLGG